MEQVALVTGGGSGMGEATAKRLAAAGMAVGVLDIDQGAANKVASSIVSGGGRASAVKADISSREEVARACAAIRESLGPITVLINNAGIERIAPFESLSDSDWDRIIDVNLKGAFIVTQTVLPDMKQAGRGRIVNISSLAAQAGKAGMVDYAAAKGGISSMTKSLAQELGPLGITVNAVAPGFILTPMTQRVLDEAKGKVSLEQTVAHYPIRRAGKPEEIAEACAYFVSDLAAYTTGQILAVNGGLYM